MNNEADWPADARRDRLIGDWHLYQRTGGHRTSTDDLITAWYASRRAANPVSQYLDLGCGIGSVLLMVSHRLQPREALGVEAQPQSVLLAKRAVSELPPCETSFEIESADFRDLEFGDRRFDLITGSPPYFPLSSGVLPADGQRRACRFEERGGVEVYAQAAARALSEKGRFVLVHQTLAEGRVREAAAQAELHLHGRSDFLMRTGRDQPFLTVFEFGRNAAKSVEQLNYTIRDQDGEITGEYEALRLELGVADKR